MLGLHLHFFVICFVVCVCRLLYLDMRKCLYVYQFCIIALLKMKLQLLSVHRSVILVWLIAAVSATATQRASTTPRMSTTVHYTTPRISSTTSSKRTTYYYMDNSYGQCGSYSYNYLNSKNSVAYVKAWSSASRRARTSSCQLTFASYGADDLKYRFTSSYISDCSVTLNIYRSSSTSGLLSVSLSCTSLFVHPAT